MCISEKEYREFARQYRSEEEEILVLLSDANGGAGKGQGTLWSASAYFLAYQNVETGVVSKGDGRLVWPMTDEDVKKYHSSYPYYFKRGGIYKVRVRELMDRTVPEGMSPSFFNRYLVVAVLEENIENDTLTAILEAYRKPVVWKDANLGEFVLNKELNLFGGYIEWLGEEISIHLDVDKEDEATWTQAFHWLHIVYQKKEAMDQEFRRYAAGSLTELANDWLEDEEAPPIKEEDFIRRITLSELAISFEGDYSAYYFDDDIFGGHSITVHGNIEKGMRDANIEG